MDKIISVIMPAYNCEQYIDEAIQSILTQKYSSFELIVIDDASTDATADKLQRYTDSRVRILTNDVNRGVSYSANRGFAEACGTYIARVDADDIQHSDRLLMQMQYLEKNPEVVVCGTNMHCIGAQTGMLRYASHHDTIACDLLFYCSLAQPSAMFRKSFIDEHHLRYNESLSVAEDYELWFRISHDAKGKMGNIPQSLVQYRIHTHSLSHKKNDDMRNKASMIRLSYLNRLLGREATPHEIAIHDALYTNTLPTTTHAVEAAHHWLLQLLEANNACHVYPQEAFAKTVARKFYQTLMTKLSLGMFSYQQLCSFPGIDRVGFTEQAKLSVLATLQSQYMHKKHTQTVWTPGEPIRVLFLGERTATWSCLHSIWDSMRKNPLFETTIVALTCFFSGQPDDTSLFFATQKIPYVTQTAYSLQEHKPHIIFSCMPYEIARPKPYSTEQLLQSGARICYIPYGLEVGGGKINQLYQYGQPIHKHAWRVFCASQDHARHFANKAQRDPEATIASGFPKIDAALGYKTAKIPDEWHKKAANKPCILWNAHFSVPVPTLKNSVWSTWHIFGEKLIDMLYTVEDAVVLLRLHPQFFPFHRQQGLLDSQQEAALRKKIAHCPALILDEEPNYLPAFAFSHGMMSDSSSLLLEYAPTQKPICYLKAPDSERIQERIQTLVQSYYTATTLQQIKYFIKMIVTKKDPLAHTRMQAQEHLLGQTDGRSGERIAASIYSAMLNDYNTTQG